MRRWTSGRGISVVVTWISSLCGRKAVNARTAETRSKGTLPSLHAPSASAPSGQSAPNVLNPYALDQDSSNSCSRLMRRGRRDHSRIALGGCTVVPGVTLVLAGVRWSADGMGRGSEPPGQVDKEDWAVQSAKMPGKRLRTAGFPPSLFTHPQHPTA